MVKGRVSGASPVSRERPGTLYDEPWRQALAIITTGPPPHLRQSLPSVMFSLITR
jgi:hypothetical protein